MANSLYENNANKDGELSPVTPAMVMPSLEYPVEGVCDTILYLGQLHRCNGNTWLYVHAH